MPRAAVLGSPIAHSLSPTLHRAGYAACSLTSWRYDAYDVAASGLVDFVAALGDEWAGLSLTMPLKERAFAVASRVSDRAQAAEAINTLTREGGAWIGDNTDIEGIVQSVRHVEHDGRATVLGSGATSRSAVLALAELGVQHLTVAARNAQATSETLALASDLGLHGRRIPLGEWAIRLDPLVVSTLPPQVSESVGAALEAGSSARDTTVLDVVYADWPTPLARHVRAAGGQVVSGLDMLVYQAGAQFALFTGESAPVNAMFAAGRHAVESAADPAAGQ